MRGYACVDQLLKFEVWQPARRRFGNQLSWSGAAPALSRM